MHPEAYAAAVSAKEESVWLCVETVRSTASTAAAAEPKAVEKKWRSEVGTNGEK